MECTSSFPWDPGSYRRVSLFYRMHRESLSATVTLKQRMKEWEVTCVLACCPPLQFLHPQAGDHLAHIWFPAVLIPVVCMCPKKTFVKLYRIETVYCFYLLSKKSSFFLWISLMLFHSLFESSVGPMPSEPVLAGAGIKSSYKNYSPKNKTKQNKIKKPTVLLWKLLDFGPQWIIYIHLEEFKSH